MAEPHKQALNTDKAWDWGDLPYPQGILSGDLVFVSGQLGIDLKTGKPAAGGIKAQTRAVLEQIQAILETAGCTLEDVLKTTCYLTNRERDYVGFNEVYREFFPSNTPARATIEISKLAPGYDIEIEAVARRRQ
jgi:2-iminobutanoate/2-iminopropanoate deaminase